MDQTQLKQKIAEYYAKLSPEAQEVFSSMAWMEKLKEIIAKYNLNSQQTETLGTETTLVLLGIIHLGEYVEILTKELGIETDTLEKIIDEIDEQILVSIKGALVETFESNVSSLIDKNNPQLEDLPKEEQQAISNSGWRQELSRINQNHKFNILQAKILEDTTLRVINNSIPLDKYSEEIASKISILPEEAIGIAEEVKEKIFNKIKQLTKIEKVINSDLEKTPKPAYDDVPLPPYSQKKEDVLDLDSEPVSYTERNRPDPYHEEIG